MPLESEGREIWKVRDDSPRTKSGHFWIVNPRTIFRVVNYRIMSKYFNSISPARNGLKLNRDGNPSRRKPHLRPSKFLPHFNSPSLTSFRKSIGILVEFSGCVGEFIGWVGEFNGILVENV